MKTENSPLEFINKLIIQHRIPLEKVGAYIREHEDDLRTMKRIFDHKTDEDAQRLLTLPSLLVPAEAEQVIDYVKQEEGGNDMLAHAEPDLEQYKLLLLSAFVYDLSFFAMSWNWCAYVKDKVRKNTKPSLHVVQNTADPRIVVFKPARRIRYQAAAELGFHDFGETTDLVDGTLIQLGAEIGGNHYLQFRFDITSATVSRPLVVEIELTTLKDGENYRVKIEDDADNLENRSIRSKPVKADYSHGIEIHQVDIRLIGKDE